MNLFIYSYKSEIYVSRDWYTNVSTVFVFMISAFIIVRYVYLLNGIYIY